MSQKFFSVATPEQAIFNGRLKLDANQTGVYNGFLAGLSSGNLVISAGSPIGVFYDFKPLQESPSSESLDDLAGTYCNIASGTFLALVGRDLFKAGSIPAAGTKLYDGGNGKYDVSGETAIGQVLNANIASVPHKDGAQTLALVRFDFSQLI